jgi:pimeloyl-ACP methyl ester carboxylesterase
MSAFHRVLLTAAILIFTPAKAEEPFGVGLEGFEYPYPVSMLQLEAEGTPVRMAYMAVAPDGEANGRTVLLLHGRNFPAAYWQGVIEVLTKQGYRVVAPDQIGFGKSSKPHFDLHFDDLAGNTAGLLDKLGIEEVDIVAHSMGCMLAVRFARSYPERARRLLLSGPIGLEDYRLYVPPVPIETIMADEDRITTEEYSQALQTRFAPAAPPEALEPYVQTRMHVRGAADYPIWLRALASSHLMIWREPVVYEMPLIEHPTLIVMGERDHVAPGRN